MIYSPLTIPNPVLCEGRKLCLTKGKLLQLARNLLSKICAKVIDFLRNIIQSEEFISRYRQSSRQFTRTRKLPFHHLILLLLSPLRGSYQDELDKFFMILFRLSVPKRFVTKAALSKARRKLKYEAFIELNLRLIHFLEEHFSLKTWKDFRLLAIDGSMVRLPRTTDIAEHFGQWKGRLGRPCPIARISQLYDTLNHITIDAAISPKRIGERELAAQHLHNVQPKDLILMDRGYPAWWLFALVVSQGADFCARVSSRWPIIRSFLQSGVEESVIYLSAPAASIEIARELGLPLTPLKLRLLRLESDGKTQILITSLTDGDRYGRELFSELYHERWPIEEDYNAIKCRLELENFSGQSATSVYQDFHAKVLLKNLVSLMCLPVNDALAETHVGRTHDYKVNFTQAISKSRSILILLFQSTKLKLYQLVQDLQDVLMVTIEPVRPGRKCPRNLNARRSKFSQAYKPLS